MTDDPRQHSPAADRNAEPILQVLRRALPASGRVLEIAAGTGQHAVHFARALPGLSWLPTDPEPAARRSIEARRREAGLSNLEPPGELDVRERPWPVDDAAAIVCINMIHIAPWACAESLFAEAGRLLPVGGPLVLYGPFKHGGVHTAESNARFDAQLRDRDPRWGVRDLDEVQKTAAGAGLTIEEVVEMPANNLTLVFRK